MKGKPSRARVATPEGLDAVYGVHAVRALFEHGQPPRELWIQEGRAEARLVETYPSIGAGEAPWHHLCV